MTDETKPSDAEIAAACRWLNTMANVVHIHARPDRTVQEALCTLAREAGWPGLPQPERTYTRAEVLAYARRVVDYDEDIRYPSDETLAALLDESRKP